MALMRSRRVEHGLPDHISRAILLMNFRSISYSLPECNRRTP
jgi:hypothetical protein